MPNEFLEQVLKAFANEKYKNKRIIVEEAKAKGSSKKTSSLKGKKKTEKSNKEKKGNASRNRRSR